MGENTHVLKNMEIDNESEFAIFASIPEMLQNEQKIFLILYISEW